MVNPVTIRSGGPMIFKSGRWIEFKGHTPLFWKKVLAVMILAIILLSLIILLFIEWFQTNTLPFIFIFITIGILLLFLTAVGINFMMENLYVRALLYQPEKDISFAKLSGFIEELLKKKLREYKTKKEHNSIEYKTKSPMMDIVISHTLEEKVYGIIIRDIDGTNELLLNEIKSLLIDEFGMRDGGGR
jgi:hypothetical protein